jgi:methionyl-tRNA formyltransferase
VRLVFAGTPKAAVPALRALLASRHEVVAVLTRPDAPAGRGRRTVRSPVALEADAAGVPVMTPERVRDPAFLAQLSDLAPDCCPVVAYGALIPARALEIPLHGWINLHFSLLPAWRGAAPVQHAILRGDDVTGATAFLLDEGLDTGPIYGVVTEPIGPTETSGRLLDRLAASGAALLVTTLDGVESGTLRPVPQPSDGVSLAPKLTVDDARVAWTDPAIGIDRRVRACTPSPGAWTTFRGDRIKLSPVRLLDEDLDAEPGRLRVERARVLVATSTTPVELVEVQPPGKRAMSAADWSRGARIADGECVV